MQAPKTFKFARSSGTVVTWCMHAVGISPSPSPVLSQVQSFLPELAQANTALQQRVESEGSEGVAVECNEEEEKKAHIEMVSVCLEVRCCSGCVLSHTPSDAAGSSSSAIELL